LAGFFYLIEAKETKGMTTMCPECDGQLSIPEDAVQGEIIPCPDCGAELEVLSLNPIKVSLAPEVQEDWGE
jgi:alpha-aminoadipate/glutamate carrier protein LysW